MTLEVAGVELKSRQVPVSGYETEDEISPSGNKSGLDLMDEKSIEEKPYFVMYLLDMNTGKFDLITLPISVALFQDMIDFDMNEYFTKANKFSL